MDLPIDRALAAVYIATFGVRPSAEQLVRLRSDVGENADRLEEMARLLHDQAAQFELAAPGSFPDHSQNGELRLILKELVRYGQRHGIIVDVGANGLNGSNSYDLLMRFGWKGLLIEANPALDERIRREFGPVDYELLSCAVGAQAGWMTLYDNGLDGTASLIRDKAAYWAPVKKEVEVEVRRLADILIDARIPHDFDILDIDIEGVDVEVLNDLVGNSAYRPRWVLIEAFSENRDDSAITAVGLSREVAEEYCYVDRTLPNMLLRYRGL